MKLTLMIEGEAAALAAILASLPQSVGVVMPDDEGDDNAPLNPNAPMVDSSGLPWDERIHSSSKAIVGSGQWRKRKGVADATVTAVEAELRQRAPAPMIAQVQPPMIIPPAPMAPPPMVAQPLAAPVPPLMPPPLAPPPVAPMAPPPMVAQPLAAPIDPTQYDFSSFMQHLSVQMGKLDPATNTPLVDAPYLASIAAQMTQAYAASGVVFNAITDISADQAYVTYAVQLLQRDLKW